MAVRRLSAMKYRLAGATYRVIAEKLTEERAQVYAEANGVSIDRAMKKIQPVASKTAWEDVTAEMEDLRRETEVQRADLMALENARLDQLFAKALSLYGKGRVPAGRLAIATMGRRCLFVAGSIVAGTRPAASRCRGTRRTRRTRGRCRECVCPKGAGCRSFGVLCCSSTTTYRYFWTAPRSAVAPAE